MAARGYWPAFFPIAMVVALCLACGHSPTNPSGTHSVIAAGPVLPADGAKIQSWQQPITLTIANGQVLSEGGPAVDHFEVATDALFTTLVASLDIPQGSGAQTSVTLGTLAPAATYFWHVRTQAGDSASPFSQTRTFAIGASVVLDAPVLLQPANAGVTGPRPTLAVTDVTRTGPAGPLSYRFELATTSSFDASPMTAAVSEQAVTTQFTPAADLVAGQTYYWRVQATDSVSGAVGARSAVRTFSVVRAGQTTLATPTPLTPLGVLTGPRPGIAVGYQFVHANVLFEFDVANDPQFAAMASSSIVGCLAGSPSAPFSCSDVWLFFARDLDFGTPYYWRARAVNPSSGERGPFTSTQVFWTTPLHADTTSYTLVVSAPSSCREPRAVVSDGAFDGSVFRSFNGRVAFSINGGQISGTASGSFLLRNRPDSVDPLDGLDIMSIAGRNGPAAAVSGMADGEGRMFGTLDGQVVTTMENEEHDLCESTLHADWQWTLYPPNAASLSQRARPQLR